MANYTIATTAPQEKAVDWLVRRENQRRAALSPPLSAVTNDQLIQKVFGDAIASYVEQFKQRVHEEVKRKYDVAVAGTQTSVRTTLAVDPDTII